MTMTQTIEVSTLARPCDEDHVFLGRRAVVESNQP